MDRVCGRMSGCPHLIRNWCVCYWRRVPRNAPGRSRYAGWRHPCSDSSDRDRHTDCLHHRGNRRHAVGISSPQERIAEWPSRTCNSDDLYRCARCRCCRDWLDISARPNSISFRGLLGCGCVLSGANPLCPDLRDCLLVHRRSPKDVKQHIG